MTRIIDDPAPDDRPAHSPGRLEAILAGGGFAVTAETTPPASADAQALLARAAPLAGTVDAVNVTDGAGARVRMASLAAAAILARAGIEPVMQMTVRDRNRLALQGDLLGAAALGVPSILCLRGDSPESGDQPEARPVDDLDSLGLIATVASMRDRGTLPGGQEIASPPRLLIGAAETPSVPDATWSIERIVAKIDAGADFFQTQFCFELDVARRWIARLREEGLTERAAFLVGIGPLSSARAAAWMRDNLFGVSIPDAVLARLERAADPREEGIRICVELAAGLAETPGVAGIHLMGPRQEAAIAETVSRARLGPAHRRRALDPSRRGGPS